MSKVIRNKAGAVLAQSAFTSSLTTVSKPNTFTVADDIYEEYTVKGVKSPLRRLKFRKGQVITQQQVDDLYAEVTVTNIAPATGGIAGGTVVTITGTNLDGVTGVTFGGTAGTALNIVSKTSLKVTTPAKAAGPYPVVVQSPAGNITQANAFTYA